MKRLISILLCLCLLSGTVTAYAASAGSAGDPLVTQSYMTDAYLPTLNALLREKLDAAITELLRKQGENASFALSSAQVVEVSAGGSVALTTGQSFILLSGSARVSIGNGSLVNATTGAEEKSGSVSLFNHYIVCEDSSVTVNMMENVSIRLSSGAVVTQGDGKMSPFTDVTRADWFFHDVVNAYERGLVNGMTAATYAPAGELTVAQAIKLAACMHQLYYKGEVTLTNSSEGAWHDSYVSYALSNGIISGAYEDYNASISRADFVTIFYKALPSSEYAAINSVPSGSIPDVGINDSCGKAVYAFYRAGILTGYEDGSFAPGSSIVRSEVATIMNRMFDTEARKSFSMD